MICCTVINLVALLIHPVASGNTMIQTVLSVSLPPDLAEPEFHSYQRLNYVTLCSGGLE